MREQPDGSQKEDGIGVPGAMAMAVRLLLRSVPLPTVRRLWLFPSLLKGRKEQGLLAAEVEDEVPGRARLVTVRYRAEENGTGISFLPEFREEGEVPADRLPGIMSGVVRRSGLQLGEPREVILAGQPEAVESLLGELEPSDAESPGAHPPGVSAVPHSGN